MGDGALSQEEINELLSGEISDTDNTEDFDFAESDSFIDIETSETDKTEKRKMKQEIRKKSFDNPEKPELHSIIEKFSEFIGRRNDTIDPAMEGEINTLEELIHSKLTKEETSYLLTGSEKLKEELEKEPKNAANLYIQSHFAALNLAQILSKEIKTKLEKEWMELYQKNLDTMRLPLEIRFQDSTIPYQEFVSNKGSFHSSLEKFKGTTGELYCGNLRIGQAICEENGSLRIESLDFSKGSKEDLVQTLMEAQFPFRLILHKGYIEVETFSKLQKNSIMKTDHLAGEALDLCLSDRLLAKGEVVTINEKFALRITEMVSPRSMDPQTEKERIQSNASQTKSFPVPMIGYEIIIGETNVPFKNIPGFGEGCICEFEKKITEPIRLVFYNGIEFSAEIVVINNYFGLKILEKKWSDEEPIENTQVPEIQHEMHHKTKYENGNQSEEKKKLSFVLEDPQKIILEYRKFTEDFPQEASSFLLRVSQIPVLDFYKYETSLTPMQHVAILILLTKKEVAQQLIKNFPEEDFEKITIEIIKLGMVEPSEVHFALNIFHHWKLGSLVIGGISSIKEIMELDIITEKTLDTIKRLSPSNKDQLFGTIRKADTSSLLNFLQGEHPQTIALVLSHLEQAEAGEILMHLPYSIQAEVMKRVATMDRVSSYVIREVARVLEKKLSVLESIEFAALGGIDAVVEILRNVDSGTHATVIEALEEDVPELAEEIKKREFV